MTQKKIQKQVYALNMSEQLYTDVAVIREKIERMEKVLDKAVCDNDETDRRVTVLEQRTGLLAGVQGVFTLIVGAISAYFGGRQ